MRKFLIKTSLFVLLLMAFICGVFYMADGRSDPFYMRLATPKQTSLILGSSKAAQGIIPSVLEAELPNTEIFNFSFTVGQSPYGPAYLEGIKNKLDTTALAGIFIITVDAYSISAEKTQPNSPSLFPEREGFLAATESITSTPNIDYLIHHYSEPYYKILVNKSPLFLHNDGWLEVTLDKNYLENDEALNRSVKNYSKRNLKFAFSKTRYDYLEKTINFLRKYGEVFVVRMPVDPLLFAVEEAYMPDFEELLTNTAARLKVPYKNFSSQNAMYQYTDGLHLYKESGVQFSKDLAAWIKE
jgi:hypothetical protein